MTTIIAFVSQKGGVGKSTLSRALAREAAHNGLKVKIADLDTQQGTSIDWHRTRLQAGIAGRGGGGLRHSRPGAQDCRALRSADHRRSGAHQQGPWTSPRWQTWSCSRPALPGMICCPPCANSTRSSRPAFPRKMVFALNHIGTPAEEAEAGLYRGSRLCRAGRVLLSGWPTGKPRTPGMP